MANQCTDPAIYTAIAPQENFEEGRAATLSLFQDGKLEPQHAEKIQLHLQECDCCTQFLKKFESIDRLKDDRESYVYAVCPSSEKLDAFIFDRSVLPAGEVEKIQAHLQQCPMCKEESEWLRSVEDRPAIQFVKPQKNYFQVLTNAAAIFFMITSLVLLWQQHKIHPPEQRLQALAVVKTPAEIDYASLDQTAVQLPEATQGIYSNAVAMFRQSNFKEASRGFEEVLSQVPGHSASIYLLGYCYYQLGVPERAFELCDRAEQMKPKSGERCMSLVMIALKTGHYDRALMEISALYHDYPDNPKIKYLYEQITSMIKGRAI